MLLRLLCLTLLVSSVSGFARTAVIGGKLSWKKAKDGREEYLAITTQGGRAYSLSAVRSLQKQIILLEESGDPVQVSGELRANNEFVVREISSK